MAFEQRDNSGSLFKNEKKTDEKHADYKGSAMIDGQEYWMSSWFKTGKSGVKFMSFAFELKKEQSGSKASSNKKEAKEASDDSEDMPF